MGDSRIQFISRSYSPASSRSSSGSASPAPFRVVEVSDPSLRTKQLALQNIAVQEENNEPFYICDLGDVYRKFQTWQTCLPSVAPHYAVKCNPDDVILDALVACGTGFDCASQGEIQKIIERGVAPDKIIYAHPCKPIAHLKYAKKVGVRKMTFDNEDELRKIKAHYPEAQLVIRILVDDSFSLCKFNTKFGCGLDQTQALLQVAKELALDVIGVSFHVGSGCSAAAPFADGVARARTVFDQGAALGYTFSLLDLGGGFPGDKTATVPFEDIAVALNRALAVHFPPESNVRVIAEPGRYFVASAVHLAVNIVSRRAVSDDNGATKYMYYVNDGVYGSFNCVLFDHQVCTPFALADTPTAGALHASSVWGPTCDSMDHITPSCQLPVLDIGDWLFYENMGAYTFCAGSNFNGFSAPNALYTFTVEAKDKLEEIPLQFPLLPMGIECGGGSME